MNLLRIGEANRLYRPPNNRSQAFGVKRLKGQAVTFEVHFAVEYYRSLSIENFGSYSLVHVSLGADRSVQNRRKCGILNKL
jgi:hypothetical protein